MKKFILVFLVCYAPSVWAIDASFISGGTNNYNYNDSMPAGPNKKRLRLISGIHIASYAGTFFLLGETWYKNYPRSPFHIFNDSKEWLQIDKVGHGWTAYNIVKYSTGMWRWTGLPRKKAVVLGTMASVGYLTILEYLDARSAQWGWSWTDMAANISGNGIYAAQELAWNEQRILFKFSAHKIKYNSTLVTRADELYGKTLPERLLKDYNGQTYWFSANVKSFFKQTNVPPWLNVAVGYGGKGMFGGFENRAYNNAGNLVFDRRDIARQRQWYISPDIDFTRIKTNSKALKIAFSVLNLIRLPAPTLELSAGKLKGHLLFF